MDTETEARQDEAAYLRCQVQLLTDEVKRLRNKVEQLQREVADAKRWAMQERTLRWHNLAAEGFAEAASELPSSH